jgi:hypothetical protein
MRRPRDPEPVSLTSGLVLVVLGTTLLLDRVHVLNLDFGSLAPIVLAAVGAVLLVSGLTRGERR